MCLASRRQDQSHYWSILLTCALGIAHIESVCGPLLEASRSGETCDTLSRLHLHRQELIGTHVTLRLLGSVCYAREFRLFPGLLAGIAAQPTVNYT